MEFAELLRELLYITHLKSGHMASALGYDTSYISRWVNGVKLPSLKNNEDLLRSIARFFVSNSAQPQLDELRRRYSLEDETYSSHAALIDALTRLLSEAYSAQSGSGAARGERTFGGNCEIVRGLDSEHTWELIASAARDVGRDGTTGALEMFTLTPLHYLTNRDREFFDVLRREVPRERPIHISQFIHFENLRRHVDEYCRTVCFFLSRDPDDLHYDFYEIKESFAERSAAMIIRDGIYSQWLNVPFSNSPYMVITRQRDLVNELYLGMSNYVRTRRALIERRTNAELYVSQYYMNYLMHGSFRYLLATMHPISMEPGTLHEIAETHMRPSRGQEWSVGFTEKTFTLPRRAVIYKSAMMSYLYDGAITLFDRTFTLTKSERIRHLRGLIEALKTEPGLSLTIIEDDNPIMRRSDLGISVYLSDGAVFARGLSKRGEPEPPTYAFTSTRLIDAMNEFYDHLENLPDEYALRGERVIDFLTHGIELI